MTGRGGRQGRRRGSGRGPPTPGSRDRRRGRRGRASPPAPNDEDNASFRAVEGTTQHPDNDSDATPTTSNSGGHDATAPPSIPPTAALVTKKSGDPTSDISAAKTPQPRCTLG